MTKLFWWAAGALLIAGPAQANDWEKFYRPIMPTVELMPSTTEPELVPTTSDPQTDVGNMWRKGFAAIGYTSFNTSNDKTADAMKLARKLKARYVIVSTSLLSSHTSAVPLTLPNTTTSSTNGTVSAYGSSGSASGTYTGTTTTYGTQTTYIPITINRFEKNAIFFMEAPKRGAGIRLRDLNDKEVAAVETRRAFVVMFVRDDSPAYNADLLPGDIVLQVNGLPADPATWQAATRSEGPMKVHCLRNGQPRDIAIVIPPDWHPAK